MTIEQLRLAYKATPFQPFAICLADGRQIEIEHPEFLYMAPNASRTFIVASPTPNAYQVLDLLLVTSLDFRGSSSPKQGKTNGHAG